MKTLQGTPLQVDLPMEAIAAFCRKWKIKELAVFGSVLRDDFDPEKSDIDFLVTFKPRHRWGLLAFAAQHRELKEILGREVDLVLRPGIEKSSNWIRRKDILDSAETLYVAP